VVGIDLAMTGAHENTSEDPIGVGAAAHWVHGQFRWHWSARHGYDSTVNAADGARPWAGDARVWRWWFNANFGGRWWRVRRLISR
jgi:hypothetical protein